jgi:hypothetical protein
MVMSLPASGLRNIPRSRVATAFIFVVMVMSSPVFMLPYQAPVSAASIDRVDSSGYHSTPIISENISPASTSATSTTSTPSTSEQHSNSFTTQGALNSVTAKQSNNIVNTRAYYDITFTTASGGSISRIIIDFPVGTLIGVSGLLVEREGIGAGTAAKTGPLQITYIVIDPVFIPPGTTIRLELSTIDNPPDAGASYKVTVTTKRPAGTTIDGPTQSTAYKIKSIEGEDVSEGFMKRVTVQDTPNGHAVGWTPDNSDTGFFITEPAIADIDRAYVSISAIGSPAARCEVWQLSVSPPGFSIECENPPAPGNLLYYVVENLPAHVIE